MSDTYYACPICGCTDVETQMWVKANANEPTDCVDGNAYFCPRCEDIGDGLLAETDKLDPHDPEDGDPPFYKKGLGDYLRETGQITEPHDAREHGAQADARAQAMGWDDDA